jgi:hypothetical protein
VHRECALVDQQDDQTNSENTEDHCHDCQRHNPPSQILLGWSHIPTRETDQYWTYCLIDE